MQASELEPLVRMDGALAEADEQDELDAVELKLTLKKSGNRAVRIAEQPGGPSSGEFRKTHERPFSATEVIELRRELKRLADEYKVFSFILIILSLTFFFNNLSMNYYISASRLGRWNGDRGRGDALEARVEQSCAERAITGQVSYERREGKGEHEKGRTSRGCPGSSSRTGRQAVLGAGTRTTATSDPHR